MSESRKRKWSPEKSSGTSFNFFNPTEIKRPRLVVNENSVVRIISHSIESIYYINNGIWVSDLAVKSLKGTTSAYTSTLNSAVEKSYASTDKYFNSRNNRIEISLYHMNSFIDLFENKKLPSTISVKIDVLSNVLKPLTNQLIIKNKAFTYYEIFTYKKSIASMEIKLKNVYVMLCASLESEIENFNKLLSEKYNIKLFQSSPSYCQGKNSFIYYFEKNDLSDRLRFFMQDEISCNPSSGYMNLMQNQQTQVCGPANNSTVPVSCEIKLPEIEKTSQIHPSKNISELESQNTYDGMNDEEFNNQLKAILNKDNGLQDNVDQSPRKSC